MLRKEVGRVLYKNLTLIEYENADSFFVQCGIAGFYASEEELYSLYCLLNYYYNIEAINNTVVSLTEGADDFMEDSDELAV